MNLETMRRLEDLHIQLAPLQQQLTARTTKVVDEVKDTVVEQFRDYFVKAGFTVHSEPNRMTAKYGGLEFVLGIDDSHGFGSFCLYKLTWPATLSKPPISISMVRKNSPGAPDQASSRNVDPLREAQDEIAKTQRLLAEPAPEFVFVVVDHQSQTQAQMRLNAGSADLKTYPAFASLLADICP